MEVTTCNHTTRIEQAADSGIEIGECSKCHMKRQYDRRGAKTIVQLIKLGRIDGKIVLPLPDEGLLLSDQETAELKAARKGPAIVPAALMPAVAEETTATEKPAAIEEPKAKIPKSIKKTAKNCRICRFSLILDGKGWCTSKRCPSRYPASTRPPYRLPKSGKTQSPGKKELISPPIEEVNKAIKGADTQLPPLPEWAPEKWGGIVAVQWLITYEALASLAMKLNHHGTPETEEEQQVQTKKRSWLSRLFNRGTS